MSRGCDHCEIRIHDELEHKGCQGHHHPGCPEMFFASGVRRGVVPESEVAFVRRRGTLTLQDELAGIFKQEAPSGETEA